MSIRERKRNQTKLAFDDIKDEPIQVKKGNKKLNDSFCDLCLIETLNGVNVNIALYLCYVCKSYLCQKCFKGHEFHQFFKKSEKERLKKCFRDEIMNESKSERKEQLNKEDVSFVEKVNLKHELDEWDHYKITGLCGLDDTRWVICDNYNDCIKVFSIGSHILQRYIRFGSEPHGVTAIHVKRKKVKPLFKRFKRAVIKTFFSVKRDSTEQGIIPTQYISVPNQSNPDKHCLLAVTLPGKRRILFIDLTQNPAVITKSIKTKKHCRDIALSGDQIVTVCSDKYRGGPWFISVLSTGGLELKTIITPLDNMYEPRLAVCPGRFYLTDFGYHKVLCMSDERKIVSHNTIGMWIERLWPYGISVDPDTEKVYICGSLPTQFSIRESRVSVSVQVGK